MAGQPCALEEVRGYSRLVPTRCLEQSSLSVATGMSPEVATCSLWGGAIDSPMVENHRVRKHECEHQESSRKTSLWM